MVSKVRTQSRFSFNVRMKRSAQPLPSGARTKAGELSMPRKVNLSGNDPTCTASRGRGAEPDRGRLPWRTHRNAAVRPGGSAPGPGSGWPGHAHGGRRIRRSSVPRSTVDWDTSQADDFRTRGEPWTIKRTK